MYRGVGLQKLKSLETGPGQAILQSANGNGFGQGGIQTEVDSAQSSECIKAPLRGCQIRQKNAVIEIHGTRDLKPDVAEADDQVDRIAVSWRTELLAGLFRQKDLVGCKQRGRRTVIGFRCRQDRKEGWRDSGGSKYVKSDDAVGILSRRAEAQVEYGAGLRDLWCTGDDWPDRFIEEACRADELQLCIAIDTGNRVAKFIKCGSVD